MTAPTTASNPEHRFQVDLHGLIDLLSRHLYSSPQVYLRELLQNGTDAITLRLQHDPGLSGMIGIETIAGSDGSRTLVFEDNGIGLTEEEIHEFLATIGRSSKRTEVSANRLTFIGQFGIGMLSCFMVSDEIVMLTRSARGPGHTLEWRGRADGTYVVRRSGEQLSPGTRVYLRARPEHADLLSRDTVRELARRYGGMLPHRILLRGDGGEEQINSDAPPWRRRWDSPAAERRAYLEFAESLLGDSFFDAIPVRSAVGGVAGVALVLPFGTGVGTRQQHRLYLKNMLLSEKAEDILPDWAFFVRCVLNADDLTPTASRESFYEDEKLDAVRGALSRALERYLVELAAESPERLQRLIALHYRALKALAAENVELLRVFADWLPFETTCGEMPLAEIRRLSMPIRYVSRVDQFREVARVASAQGLVVVNAGYSYDAEILERLPEVFPEVEVEPFESTSLAHELRDLTIDERARVANLLEGADRVLGPMGVDVDVRRFEPADVPALYLQNEAANFLGAAERSRQVAPASFSEVLDATVAGRESDAKHLLCFNLDNPLVQRIVRIASSRRLENAVEMLYVQALLLGRHPLGVRQMELLNRGLLEMIGGSLSRGDAHG